MLNVWLFLFLYIGGLLPPTPVLGPNGLPDPASYDYAFYRIRSFTLSAIAASMIAFMAAQFCDVYLYHFWKRLTKGRHLWLRNNGSTMVSQLVDTICVIYITHYFAGGLPLNPDKPLQSQLWTYIASGYVFKLVAALLDTIPFYLGVRFLSSYLQIDPTKEHDGDDDEPSPVPPPATQPVAVSVADSSDAAV
jgi:hypothetical protein